jgi:hypothetical protein
MSVRFSICSPVIPAPRHLTSRPRLTKPATRSGVCRALDFVPNVGERTSRAASELLYQTSRPGTWERERRSEIDIATEERCDAR